MEDARGPVGGWREPMLAAVVAEIEAGRESAHDDAAAIRSTCSESPQRAPSGSPSPPLLPGSPQTLRLLRARERRPPPSAPSAPSATQCTQSAPSAPPRAPSPSDSELSTLPTTLAALREASKPSSPVASDASIDRDMLSPRDDISPVASGGNRLVIVEFACGLIWNQSAENFFFGKVADSLYLSSSPHSSFPICNPALFCLVGLIGGELARARAVNFGDSPNRVQECCTPRRS